MNTYREIIYFIALIVGLVCLVTLRGLSQELTQTVRGKIIDQDSKSPVIGASVIIVNSDPILGSGTDVNGEFKIEHVPIGRTNLKITSIGYEESYMPNLIVGTGKEVYVEIQLKESFVQLADIVIEEKKDKSDVSNEMANVSARAFSVEETKRYAGSFNDPARLVANFAGVQGNAEGSNHIVVRGNSPNMVMWRMEGIEIPNPNHFAEEGSSGGAINVLNSAMLTNSDFYTGAFVPEYGNVLGAVFDMKMRTGNNEKREYSLSAGILGTDITLEGPFKKGKRSSYLANYRYSTLAILDDIGLVDYGGVPKYEDLSFKLAFPTEKAGYFTVFGLAGQSSINEEYTQDDSDEVLQRGKYKASLGTFNINHVYFFSPNTSIESFVSASQNGSQYQSDDKDIEADNFFRSYEDNLNKYALRFSTSVNSKINSRNTLKIGGIYNRYFFDFDQKFFNQSTDEMETWLNDKDDAGLIQSYLSWKYRLTEQITFTTGVHSMYFTLNDRVTLEPRFSAKWQFKPDQSVFAGFGQHSQMASLPVYFSNIIDENGNEYQPNLNLDFMKARHYVLGYDRHINSNVYAKVEAYYQDLYNIPVENTEQSSYSLVNATEGFTDRALVNEGSGYNYGLELTIERYFSRNYYYLITTSLYESKYKTLNSITRSTMFNGNYLANILFGKEIYLTKGKKNKVLSINAKASLYGARNFTPIDLESSRELGRTVWLENQAFSKKGDDVWKIDLGVTYSWNRLKTRQELKLDVQNITNSQSKVDEYYNNITGEIEKSYQLPLFPVVMYTVEF